MAQRLHIDDSECKAEQSPWVGRARYAVSRWRPFYKTVSRRLTMLDRDEFLTADGHVDAMSWMNGMLAWDKAHPVRYRLWRIYIVGTQPVQLFEDKVTLPIKRFWQRGRRGWSYEDIWAIDDWFVNILPPMLDELRKNEHGWPGSPMTFEEWTGDGGIIDQIAHGFRSYARLSLSSYEDDERDTLQADFDKAMGLFVQYFPHLWD